MKGLERYYLKKARTPQWASQKEINKLYRQSKKLGEDFEVDHIVPLVSLFVCGLHCEDNLEIITSAENIAKSNNYWPDMWYVQSSLLLNDCTVYQLSFNY